MMTNNAGLYSIKIIIEIFKDILYFPFWWYTRGVVEVVQKNIAFLTYRQKSLGLFIWIKNVFRPMYGQTDWQGRLVSVLMRLFQIFIRGLIMLFLVIISIGLVVVWLVVPIFIFYEIIFQIYPEINTLFIG